jgi:hypothetical protein
MSGYRFREALRVPRKHRHLERVRAVLQSAESEMGWVPAPEIWPVPDNQYTAPWREKWIDVPF